MQIQPPPLDKEFDPIADFIVRLKIAYRFLKSKKAILIVDNEINVFNTTQLEVIAVASQIVGDMSKHFFEDVKQDIAIKNLVASA